MAAPSVFRREWVVHIKEMFNDVDGNPLPSKAALLRVPTPVLKMKPEAFIPQLLSLGPYHHSKLEIDIESPNCVEGMVSMAERYKVKSAVKFSQKLLLYGKNFKSIVEMMNEMRPEIERFYSWPISTEGEYSQNFALMMAIDSSFLLQFLRYASAPSISILSLDSETQIFCSTYFACMLHDIKKLENQMPLFVLKKVLDYMKKDVEDHESLSLSLNNLLPVMWHRLSPFPYDLERAILMGDQMAKEPHILGCIHRFLYQVLRMQPRDERPQRQMGMASSKNLVKWIGGLLPAVPDSKVHFSHGMSARQLATAGIKFKSFRNLPDVIRLDQDSGTLYLPKIRISDISTEVYLRNMLALEANDDPRPKYVTHYVALMGILIQSPDDVRILVDRHVICPGFFQLSDKDTAKMWRDVRQPFLRGSVTEVHDELYKVFQRWFKESYWENKIRSKLCGFYEFVLSWKFVAPVAAFLGILMTAIQTYYSFRQCSR